MTTARADPQLEELKKEYGDEWVVWRPGRYVADHRRLDVTLISDTTAGLADKLRRFAEMLTELP